MRELLRSAAQTAAAVARHECTAQEAAEAALARAEAIQPKYKPFIALTADLARAQAEAVDRRLAAGERLPLAGVPLAVKDLIDVAGVPTTGGSRAFLQRVPAADAAVVQRLVQAGAVVIGKTSLHECAFGFTGENAHFGDCLNPWDPARVPGGSSSGSAVALALGVCPLTLGSDTGGSIRLPSALCNTTGLKPTYGLVSRRGGIPLSWSMDHVGPMTRSVADAALALSVMAGHDPLDATSAQVDLPDYPAALQRGVAGLRIGLPRRWFYEELQPGVGEAVEAAADVLRAAGATLVDAELPLLHEAVAAHRAIIFAESAAYYRPHLIERATEFGDAIRPLLAAGQFHSAEAYARALRVRGQIRTAWAAAFSRWDLLLTPTSPLVAPQFGVQTAELGGRDKPLVRVFLDLTLPFDLSGHPALALPCGFVDGLPVGLQLVARPFAEELLFAAGQAYQAATDWHARLPEVA